MIVDQTLCLLSITQMEFILMDQIVTQCKILDFKANSRNEGNEGLQELIEGLRNSSQSVDNGIKNLFF